MLQPSIRQHWLCFSSHHILHDLRSIPRPKSIHMEEEQTLEVRLRSRSDWFGHHNLSSCPHRSSLSPSVGIRATRNMEDDFIFDAGLY
jgi:hypothetical protein